MNHKWLCRLGLHNWRLVRNTGIHGYFECDRCQKRLIRRIQAGGYQPIDEDWIKTGEFFDPTKWVFKPQPTGVAYQPPLRVHKVYIDVREFGATGDGVTDDSAAIQRALTASDGQQYINRILRGIRAEQEQEEASHGEARGTVEH